jgi:hypothetical protein
LDRDFHPELSSMLGAQKGGGPPVRNGPPQAEELKIVLLSFSTAEES